ncbi:galactose oxidase [Pedobacter sp. PLR]|uniref:galactose oxidase n=1 Tax=Pedobacter sp. PLR TaxID=2994465 RepID=UPI002245E45D|nr:galactose oxidase [Pedobacter sp. PLR]MCX2453902.1 galactose oxidase [Pedobacter sp. PLR]
MSKYLFYLSVPLMLTTTTTAVFAQKTPAEQIKWSVAAQLQTPDGQTSIGFAGAMNAVLQNRLIVAGGANFPDKKPWEGGKKHYSNEIHILEKKGNAFSWSKEKAFLPEAIAYCGNTSTKFGIVYAGGENDKGLSKQVFLLTWDELKHNIQAKPLASLPIALTNVALTNIGNLVYAIGGDQEKSTSNAVFSLDLSLPAATWKVLPELPIPLANSVVVVQSPEKQALIYVIGGRTKTPVGISDLHATVFIYHPEKQEWKEGAAISDGIKVTNFSAGTGVAFGKNQILIFGGDNGKTFHQIETYISRIAKTADPEEKARLTAEKNQLNIHHKGFYKSILRYDVQRNTWSKSGELPFLAQVTAMATKWNNDIIISSGEVKPGVRTPNIMLGKIKD